MPDGSPLSRIKLEPLFIALQSAGYRAVVVGEGERAHPPDALRSLAEGAGVALTDSDARFSIPGLGDLRVSRLPQLPNRHPLSEEPKRAGIAMVVLPLDVDAAAAELSRAPGWHVAVATRDPSPAPRYAVLGDTHVVVSTGRHGHYVVDLEVTAEGSRVTRVVPRIVRLDDTIAPSPIGQRILNAYQERLRDERFVERMPRLPLPGNRYAGADACRPCHTTRHTSWKASRHAAAFPSLQKDGRVFDPDCIQCHVTGFPIATGYAGNGAADPLANVGCEACHGPAGRHIANPSARPPDDPKAACATCHTSEHSPKYDPPAYLARIRHG